MLRIVRKSQFKKDFKKLRSSGKDLGKLAEVIVALQKGEPLPERNRDHLLIGDYKGHRECHVSPDRLLIYQTSETELTLVRTGSHSEMFRG
jgi:mRNA interferase YafQ